MRLLLDTTELRSLYSLLIPLCNYVPFNSSILKIVSVSLVNFSRNSNAEIWELIENCEDDELHYFLNMSDAAFVSTFDLNIDIFMEQVHRYIENLSGVRMDNCEVINADVIGNSLVVDIIYGKNN